MQTRLGENRRFGTAATQVEPRPKLQQRKTGTGYMSVGASVQAGPPAATYGADIGVLMALPLRSRRSDSRRALRKKTSTPARNVAGKEWTGGGATDQPQKKLPK